MCHKNHVCFFLLPSHTLSLTHRCAGIFSSSIKNNILFGKDYNHKLLQRVINATALATVSHFIESSHSHPHVGRIWFNFLMASTLSSVIKVSCSQGWVRWYTSPLSSLMFAGTKGTGEHGTSLVSWCRHLSAGWSIVCCGRESVEASLSEVSAARRRWWWCVSVC